jgi:hypothetical protein
MDPARLMVGARINPMDGVTDSREAIRDKEKRFLKSSRFQIFKENRPVMG